MIAFKDFVPQDITPMLALSRRHETLNEVVARANAWIAQESLQIVNVETVVLPPRSAAQNDPHFRDNMQYDFGAFEVGGQRVQLVRVWYRAS
jgi:hypothetical protein